MICRVLSVLTIAILFLSCDHGFEGNISPYDPIAELPENLIIGRYDDMMNESLWDYNISPLPAPHGIYEFRTPREWMDFWEMYRDQRNGANTDTIELPLFRDDQMLIGLFLVHNYLPYQCGFRLESVTFTEDSLIAYIPPAVPSEILAPAFALSVDLIIIPELNRPIKYTGDFPVNGNYP